MIFFKVAHHYFKMLDAALPGTVREDHVDSFGVKALVDDVANLAEHQVLGEVCQPFHGGLTSCFLFL